MAKVAKKALLFVLCFALCICAEAFVACGGSTPNVPDNPPQQEQPSNEHICSYVLEKAEEKYLAFAATCTKKAVYYKSCSCGEKGTETFEGTALGHSYTNYISNNDATCESDGTETATCDRGCGTTDTRTEKDSALGHDYGNWVSNVDGTHTKTCATDASHKKTEECHGGTATCTERPTCAFCGAKYGTALGHSYTNYIGNDDATCESDGTETATCDNGCGTTDTRMEKNSALGHDYGNWVSNGNGTHTKTCSRDRAHIETADCYGGTATCLEQATCEGCGAKYGELSKKHSFVDNRCEICEKRQSVGLEFTLNASGTEYSVTGLGTCIDTEVTIPESYNDLPVTGIGSNAFSDCASLTGIEIPDSVTNIRSSAFENCSSLKNVSIGKSVTSIAAYAFYGCNSLDSIIIPNSVTNISGYAFFGCGSLKSVTIGAGVTYIGNYAFDYCYKLVEVINLSGNLNITKQSCDNGYVGYYAINVKTDGESDIQKQDDYLFYTYNGVNYLIDYAGEEKEITLPKNYNEQKYVINDYAFYNCGLLKSVIIPDGATTHIGRFAFYNCTSLESASLPNGITSISGSTFYDCGSLKNVSIPNSVKKIENSAFYNCNALKNITIPYGVTSIGGGAFYKCGSLENVAIPDSVISIGNSAFYECCSLKNITIPSSVTSIGDYAFESCICLASVTIPNGVKFIGDNAFYNCSSLVSAEIGDGVTSIGSFAFFGCRSLTSITVAADNANYMSIDGNLYSKGGTVLIQYAIGKTETSFIIPDSVTDIGDYAFEGSMSLFFITVPSGVTNIGRSSFGNCKALRSVTFENFDGWYVSGGVTQLTLVDDLQNAKNLTGAYRYCYLQKR